MDAKSIPALKELELDARRVLVRVDFDIPMANGELLETTKIKVVLPTINYLVENGARVILMSHMGDPEGRVVPELSLEPVAAHLASLATVSEVYLTDSCIGDGARSVIQGLREGQVCLLENLGFHAGELKNDDRLARQLASFSDVYVNEAFSLAGEVRASTCAINGHSRVRAAGLQFTAESMALKKVVEAPEKPFVLLLGGDFIEESTELLESMFDRVDTLLIAGNLANTFEAARGGKTGLTQVESARLPLARSIIERVALRKDMKLILPTDVMVEQDGQTQVVPAGKVPDGAVAIDVGPNTMAAYRQGIAKASTLLWAGRVGMKLEGPPSEGTVAIARAAAGSSAYTVAHGAGVVDAIRTAGLEKGFDHVCAGGAATLKRLNNKPLPAVTALGGHNVKPLT